jgi:hypothetical protein
MAVHVSSVAALSAPVARCGAGTAIPVWMAFLFLLAGPPCCERDPDRRPNPMAIPPRSPFRYLLKQDGGVDAQGEPLDPVRLRNARVFEMRADVETRNKMEIQSGACVVREA